MKLRRISIRTPGKINKFIYKKARPKSHKCSICKKVLLGTLRERPAKLRNIGKSKKVPSRPYRGVLCSRCMRDKIKATVRGKENV